MTASGTAAAYWARRSAHSRRGRGFGPSRRDLHLEVGVIRQGAARTCRLEVDQAALGGRHVLIRALQRAVRVAAEVVVEGMGQTAGHILVDVAASRPHRCQVAERQSRAA
ncbi:hypothetical protein [Streptomyces sviceus]|uniref:hypothetical protein n=1 Tax=Streptomyces sviceus TaxID=285530 RepID=UPI00332064D0